MIKNKKANEISNKKEKLVVISIRLRPEYIKIYWERGEDRAQWLREIIEKGMKEDVQ